MRGASGQGRSALSRGSGIWQAHGACVLNDGVTMRDSPESKLAPSAVAILSLAKRPPYLSLNDGRAPGRGAQS